MYLLPHCERVHEVIFVFCLRSVVLQGHEERGEIRGEENGSTEGGPSQRPVSVQTAHAQRSQG